MRVYNAALNTLVNVLKYRKILSYELFSTTCVFNLQIFANLRGVLLFLLPQLITLLRP